MLQTCSAESHGLGPMKQQRIVVRTANLTLRVLLPSSLKRMRLPTISVG